MDIKAAVKQLTHKHKTNNPYELAQLLNIIVMYAELGSTWGYFTTYKRSKFIIINQNISEELQTYTCAHELGHSVLHKGVSTPFLKAHTLFSIDKIMTTRQTGGLTTGYKPLILASASRRWLSLCSSHIALFSFAAPVRGVLNTSYP